MRFFIAALVVGLVSAEARCASDPGWVLVREDFTQMPVSLMRLDSAGLSVLPLGQTQPVGIPMEQFFLLERPSAAPVIAEGFVVVLFGGQRLAGRAGGVNDEKLLWKQPILGDLQIPLKDVRAVVRSGEADDQLPEPPPEDRVLLANLDHVEGIVMNLTEMGVTIRTPGGPVELLLESVRRIDLVPVGLSLEPRRAFHVGLRDGSVLAAAAVEVDGSSCFLELADGIRRRIPLSEVLSIEQLNGPVSWLSGRQPSAIVQKPYCSPMTWPTRMDRSVTGQPIQFGGRKFARGIGVHAYSRLDFPLDGTHAAFRTQYAIAQEHRREFADVTVRILVDGIPVHEQVGFKADRLSPVVLVDLPKDARMLTLEVDYGQTNDTQDRFNWIEPALLRRKPPQTRPASAPSTQPG